MQNQIITLNSNANETISYTFGKGGYNNEWLAVHFTNNQNGATGELHIDVDYKMFEWNDFDNNLLGDDVSMLDEIYFGQIRADHFARAFTEETVY